jgi:hypothetical protein
MPVQSISPRSRGRHVPIALLFLAAIVICLARPSESRAITLGSDLSNPPISSWGCGGSPCTGVQLAFPGETNVSPTNGTITTWRVRGATGTDTGRLRVLTPNGGTSYTFKGSSATVTVPGSSSVSTFTTSLPIAKGDLIGLDDDHLGGENFGTTGANSGAYLIFQPEPLGGVPVIPDHNDVGELLFNADVVPTAIFPKPKRPKPGKGGIVVLTVEAPNAGILSVAAANAKAATASAKGSFVKPVTKTVAAAGDVKVKLRPTSSTKGILRRFGKASGQVKVTFTPTDGSPASRKVKITLRG